MSNNRSNFITSLITMQKQASKDSTRYAMTSVCLDIVGDKLRLRATDGHALAIQVIDIPDELLLTDPYMVDPDSIKILKSLFNSNKKGYWVLKMLENGKIQVGLAGGVSITLERLAGEYPDTNRVMPKDLNFKLALNPFLLGQLCEAMRENKSDNLCVLEMNTSEKLSAILVHFGENSGVIMPCRVPK